MGGSLSVPRASVFVPASRDYAGQVRPGLENSGTPMGCPVDGPKMLAKKCS